MSKYVNAAFDASAAPILKGAAFTTGGLVAGNSDVLNESVTVAIYGLTLAEWASVVAIAYGLACFYIATPKIVATTVRWCRAIGNGLGSIRDTVRRWRGR